MLIATEKTVFHRPRIVKTKDLRVHNQYTLALDNEYRDFAFNEERAPLNKGLWRSQVFGCAQEAPVDLEIGTGNGTHFKHRCEAHPSRRIVGLELKYKPLIQTIRSVRRMKLENGRVCRLHAFNLDQVFAAGEINDVFIHFPDPWTSPRKPKNRLVNPRMSEVIYGLQRPGSLLEVKTDSREFFDGAVEILRASPYQELTVVYDWHKDPRSQGRHKTQFEKIFSQQGLPIYYSLWQKPENVSG